MRSMEEATSVSFDSSEMLTAGKEMNTSLIPIERKGFHIINPKETKSGQEN